MDHEAFREAYLARCGRIMREAEADFWAMFRPFARPVPSKIHIKECRMDPEYQTVWLRAGVRLVDPLTNVKLELVADSEVRIKPSSEAKLQAASLLTAADPDPILDPDLDLDARPETPAPTPKRGKKR